MRVLMWFALGFGAACALGSYLLPQGMLAAATGALGVLALGLILAGIRFRRVRPAAVAVLGCCAGLAWFALFGALYLADAAAWNGVTREAELTAADYSYETDYGWAAEAYVRIDGKPYRVRVYLEEETELAPGDRISGAFRFRYTAPREWERTSRYQGKGIFLTADQKGNLEIHRSETRAWWQYGPVLAKQTAEILEAAFPEDAQPFVRALLLGDSSDLSWGVDMDLKISGIRHIIAVSGLHVTILYKLVEALTGKRRFLTALIGLPVLAIFASMAGFTPSVTRACVMVGLMMLSQVFDREYDSLTALSFACLVMLAANPLVIVNAGFQLSVSCVTGILLFRQPIDGWIQRFFPKGDGRLWRWARGCAAVSLSAMVLTVPLSAVYFGTVSLIGVVTNLLTLWAVSLVFNGLIAVCAMGLISSKLAGALGWVLAWPVRYVLSVAKLLSRAPLAAVYTSSEYIVFWLVFCYMLLAVFLIGKEKQSGVLLTCAGLGLCLALGCSWAGPLMDGCRVTMLDVGQGQCILLQSRGKTFLVDCGGDTGEIAADRAYRLLASQGIRRLDGVILTHGDDDHCGGADDLLGRIGTELMIAPWTMERDRLPQTDGRVIWADQELLITSGKCRIRIFPPSFLESGNENSLCILFEAENCGILITGDRSARGERMLLKRYDLPEVDVLVAGHHGSKDSTCRELLETVKPETVLISAGAGNVYGHPDGELLERLAQFGCTVYRSDQNGTILFRVR